MKKIISVLLAALMVFSVFTVSASAASLATVELKTLNIIAEAGVTVYVPVEVKAEKITTLAIEVEYDKTAFELVGVEKLNIGKAGDENIAVDGPDITVSPYRFDWAYINEFNYDGIAATVKLKVKENAANDNYDVKFSVTECADTNGIETTYDSKTATITVTDDRAVLDRNDGWPSSIGEKAIYIVSDAGTEKAVFAKGGKLVYNTSLFIDGIWVPDYNGFAEVNGTVYYFVNSEVNAEFTGVVNYNGAWYFVKNGAVDKTRGWKQVGSKWCFVNDKGYAVVNNWEQDGAWYYMDEKGYMVSNCWKKDSIGWVYLGSNGAMLTNAWCTDSQGWCYVGADGYAVTNCWKKDSIGWIWLNASGSMTKNAWIQDGGKWYFLDANGYMVSNAWRKDSKGWCYLGASGAMVTNAWVRDSVGWCYIGADGYAVTNCWKKDSVGWCFLNSDGSMTKNAWVKDGGKWYFCDANGYMVTGTRRINGKYYTFNSSGVWVG